jgi:hypothetical protein
VGIAQFKGKNTFSIKKMRILNSKRRKTAAKCAIDLLADNKLRHFKDKKAW